MLTVWAVTLTVLSRVVKYVRPLRFLGTGDRYRAFAAFPAGILMARFAMAASSPITLALPALGLGLMLAVLAHEIHRQRTSRPHDVDALRAVASKLAALPGSRVWAFGYSLGNEIAYWTGKTVLSNSALLNLDACEKDPETFPEPSVPFKVIATRYAIDYVLTDRRSSRYAIPNDLREIMSVGDYRLLDAKSSGP
jgi:hypothetical protein